MVAGDLTPSACISSPDLVISQEDEQISMAASTQPTAEIDNVREQYDGPFVAIKVKDLLGITLGGGMHQFVYPPFVTLKEFTKDVAEKFKTTVEEIELIYQCGGGMLEISKMPGDWTLEGASMPGDREKVYAVSIQKSKAKKKSVSRNLKYELDAAAAVEGTEKIEMNTQTSVTVNLPGPCSSLSLSGPREFVGLKNMTMTCYLNSVLQSLWFTPELRNALYRFDGEHILKTQQKSVVEGLKRLFLLLQLSGRESVGTEELTQCFGWRAEESWTQHDIEEMFRVLSDALCKELKGTEMEGLFSALFGVMFADYISCKVCGNSRERDDFQLGIPLPIRNYGQPLSNPCLEEAIQAYVSTELLTGNNRVNCDGCKDRTDAIKGLKFKKLPYLLMLHLKRYEYDFERQTRAKINDKIEFPIILNMNQFITSTAFEDVKPNDETSKPASSTDCSIPSLNPDWFITPDHGKRRTEHSRKSVMIEDTTLKASLTGETNTATGPEAEKEKPHDPPTVGYVVPPAAQHYLDTFGPHVYQLYSVLTHRGNLTGGHYYAFIFDFESNIWYRCDDTKVMRIPEDDLKATYGGDAPSSRQGLYDVGTAYMLLYRKIDEKINSLPLMFPDVPQFTQAMWLKMIEEDREARLNDAISRTVVPLQIKYPECGVVELRSLDVVLPRTLTLKEAAEEGHKLAFQSAPLDSEKARIVKYDQDARLIEYSWKDEMITLDLAFPVNKCDDMKPNSVLLEVVPATQEWELYKASDTVLFAHKVNHRHQHIGVEREIHVTEMDTVGTLKTKLRTKFRLEDDANKLQVFAVFSKHTITNLTEDDRLIGHLRFGRSNDVFFEIAESHQLDALRKFVETFVESLLFEVQIPNIHPSSDSEGEEQNASSMPSSLEDSDLSKTCLDLSATLQTVGDSNCDQPTTDGDSEATLIVDTSLDSDVSGESFDPDEYFVEVIPKAEIEANVKPPTKDQKYFFQLVSERLSPEGDWKILSVKAERKMTLTYFSKVLKDFVKVEEKDFIMYTAKDEKETEITCYEDKISQLYPFGVVRIRYGRRMSDDEARISIYYATPQNEKSPFNFVCPYVFNKRQTVRDVKTILAKLCESATGVKEPERYRIRRKVGDNPAKILKNDVLLFDYCKRYGAEIYIQTLESPEEWDASNFAFFTRLWHQDSLQQDGLKEITVYHDYSKDTEVLVAEEISSHYDIPIEFLKVSKMTNEYPYPITAYSALEVLSWFQLSGNQSKISLLSDDLCLAVIDVRVKPKDITPEELEILRKEHELKMAEIENVVIEVRPNRREIGLRINTEI